MMFIMFEVYRVKIQLRYSFFERSEIIKELPDPKRPLPFSVQPLAIDLANEEVRKARFMKRVSR